MATVLLILWLALFGGSLYLLISGLYRWLGGGEGRYIDRSVHHHYHDNREQHLHLDGNSFPVYKDKTPIDS